MQTYGDIIERIKEIIALSEQRKTEISVIELNENYNNYFVSKLWYEIAVEYAKEFEELLDAERTFYLLKNGLAKCTLKNSIRGPIKKAVIIVPIPAIVIIPLGFPQQSKIVLPQQK